MRAVSHNHHRVAAAAAAAAAADIALVPLQEQEQEMEWMGGRGAGARNCSPLLYQSNTVIIAIMIVVRVEEFSFFFWTDAPIDAPVTLRSIFSFKTNGSGLKTRHETE